MLQSNRRILSPLLPASRHQNEILVATDCKFKVLTFELIETGQRSRSVVKITRSHFHGHLAGDSTLTKKHHECPSLMLRARYQSDYFPQSTVWEVKSVLVISYGGLRFYLSSFELSVQPEALWELQYSSFRHDLTMYLSSCQCCVLLCAVLVLPCWGLRMLLNTYRWTQKGEKFNTPGGTFGDQSLPLAPSQWTVLRHDRMSH